jgi:hypothetical protein
MGPTEKNFHRWQIRGIAKRTKLHQTLAPFRRQHTLLLARYGPSWHGSSDLSRRPAVWAKVNLQKRDEVGWSQALSNLKGI